MTGCSRGPMEKSWGRLLDGGLVCTMPSGTATVSRSRHSLPAPLAVLLPACWRLSEPPVPCHALLLRLRKRRL